MANQFLKLRRSSVPGRIPTTSSLDFGEIALNTYDGLAFIKKSGSSGEEIVTIGAGTSISGITGSANYVALFSGTSSLTTSSIYQTGSFTGIRATSSLDPINPEILLVDGRGIGTYNIISAQGDLDDYIQLNIQNINGGQGASSDIVATSDNGDEDTGYINLGINSSNYNLSGLIGSASDAYLYSTGKDLYLGNASTGSEVIIFNGGFDTTANARVWIHEQGTVGINTPTYNIINPPSLQIQAPNNTTYNLIEAKADVDSYSQIAIVNSNSGSIASADFLAYNDLDPTQDLGYIDLGINSTTFSDPVNYPNWSGSDSYIYTDSERFIIGSTSGSNSSLNLFVGGIDPKVYSKLNLKANNQHLISGSLDISGSVKAIDFTGSLFGTASWALNTRTASYVLNAVSASYATTAAFAPAYLPLTGGTINGNVTVNGTASISFLNVIYETASVIYSTGSNQFGDAPNDTQSLYGLVVVRTGSLVVTGSTISTLGFTGSLLGTASWATNALTASFVPSTAVVGDFNRIATGSITASVNVGTTLFQLISGSSTFLSVSSSGNVGIGTTTPSQILHTKGTIRVENSASTDVNDISITSSSLDGQLTNRLTLSGQLLFSNARFRTSQISSSHRLVLSSNNTTGQTAALLFGVDGAQIDRGIVSDRDTANIYIVNGSNSNSDVYTPRVTFFSSGDVAIGTTTGSGYRLLVTGSGTSGSFNANNALYVSSSNVGIGIALPSRSLDVQGDAQFGTNNWLNLLDTGAGNGRIQITSVGSLDFGSFLFRNSAGTTEYMRINNSGNIGIGFIDQTAKLHISGSTGVLFEIDSNTTNNILYVTSSGQVGIRTSAPLFSLDVSGSGRFTNGLTISGSLVVTSGSTEFQVLDTGTKIGNSIADTHTITGSIGISGSVNITTNLTASRALISSSVDTISGSTLIVYGSGSSQPIFTVVGSQGELFSITDSLTGSLFSVNDISGLPVIEAFSDNRVLLGSYQAPALFTTVRVTSVSGSNVIYQNIPTSSYDGAFFDYIIKSGSNARAGQLMAIWSGNSVNYTETVTTDFGDTSAVKFMVMITGSNMALTGSFPSASWTMKTIVRSI